ncbi:MAG: response regulator transcription factor [Leucobacter sp.]
MIEPIRVLIADDHEAVRSGVAAILVTSTKLTVVAEAENGFDALAACHREQPHVALVDLRMPGSDGIWATERITSETDTRVLVLTTFDSDDLIAKALAAGAHGYLLKSTSGAELILGVEHVAANRFVIDPAIAGALVTRFTTTGKAEPDHALPLDLTDRETAVLGLLAEGLSNQHIADKLYIGLTTVKTHVGSLYAKTGAVSRVQLAALAPNANSSQR